MPSLYNSVKDHIVAGSSVLHTGLNYKSGFSALNIEQVTLPQNEGDWSSGLLDQGLKPLIDFKFETPSPTNLLLSNDWLNNINRLSINKSLTLASAPMFSTNGKPNPESLLGLIGATEIEVI
jgi:hypothetical protein